MPPLDITISFIIYGGIAFLALHDAITYWSNGGRNHVSLKGEMTGLGILGTFTGIFLGLMDFNVHDISGSIPPLLEGLKIAFGTSIAGLFASTTLTVVQAINPVSFRKTGDPIADTLVRVFQEFEPLMEDLRDANRRNTEEIIAMRKTMESTMETLSKGVTEEIITALEKVISKFNDNLKEQFGENFKRLNEACFKLVEWQEHHAKSVTQATDAMRDAGVAYDLLRKQTKEMLEKHRELLASLNLLGQQSTQLGEAAGTLGKSAASISDVMNKADTTIARFGEAIGHTEEKLKSSIENSANSFSSACSDMAGTLGKSIQSTEARIDSFGTALQDALNDSVTKVQSAFSKVAKELKALESISPSLQLAAAEAGAAASASRSATESADRTNKKAKETIALTHDQLAKALSELEKALSALTSQFSEAYRNYLDGLRKLTDD